MTAGGAETSVRPFGRELSNLLQTMTQIKKIKGKLWNGKSLEVKLVLIYCI